MPTGVALRDAREQLFAAAERVLLRDGPQALTSRTVTSEAGCAKGVLHRHFADFDTFLVELVVDRIARVGHQGEALRGAAGTGTVTEHLADALTDLFGSVALAVVGLMIFRDDLRTRLRRTRPTGVPVLAEGKDMLASYLEAERGLGRVAADADVDTLALTLVGAGHLLFAGRDGVPPEPEAVLEFVTSVVGRAVTQGRAASGGVQK